MREIAYYKYLIEEEKNDLIRVRFWIERGRLLDLVVQYESIIDGHNHPIVRFDCSHGFFHRDVLFPNGEKLKTKIPISDLKVAAKHAEKDIEDKWMFYKERYIKHLRK